MHLKVTSSNIRFENPADGDHDWPFRKDFLKDLLTEFQSDIIGTQEGREPQLRSLDELLTDFVLVDDHRDWITERMYPCIFYKKGSIEVKRSGDIWLSETPEVPGSKSFDSAFPRLCTWIEATCAQSGIDFFLVNTHLDHVKQETRVGQAEVLSQEISKANINSLPLILMGDFNDDPKSPVRKIITDKLALDDPWWKLSKDEEGSHHSFKGEEGSGIRIDWILLSKEFDCDDIFLDKSNKEGIYPSDHYPVKANIILR